MTAEYDRLLRLAAEANESYRATARGLIPRMYLALKAEDPRRTAEDIRDRIEKDCSQFWSRRTILDALPEEAKDCTKQKAARMARRQKSAAVSAAQICILKDGEGPEADVGKDGAADHESTRTDHPQSINFMPPSPLHSTAVVTLDLNEHGEKIIDAIKAGYSLCYLAVDSNRKVRIVETSSQMVIDALKVL